MEPHLLFDVDTTLYSYVMRVRVTSCKLLRRTRTISYPPHFSPDGKVFAGGWRQHEGNCLLRLWDVSAGDLLRVISIDDDYLEGVAFSPDGRSVFTGGWHSGIHVWDVHTGELLHTMTGPEGDRYSDYFYRVFSRWEHVRERKQRLDSSCVGYSN